MATSKSPKSSRSSTAPLALWLGLALVVILLDHFTKVLILGDFRLHDTRIVTSFFNVVRAHNTGAAFGILQNARWLFVVIAVIFVAVVVFALWKNIIRDPLGRWSALLVMAGAIGNCIDRVMNGFNAANDKQDPGAVS